MQVQIVTLYALFCVGWSRDVMLGSDKEGRKIFDETRQATPAIWRQYENVTIIAPENELIGKVVVTDMRPEKDGDVEIVDGGDGQKSITIELKSPTVLRGYEFHIEVYSVPETVGTDAEESLLKEEIGTSPNDLDLTTELIEKATSDYITGIHDMTSNSVVDVSVTTPMNDAPAVVATDLNDNSFRPARETSLPVSTIVHEFAVTNAEITTEIATDGSKTEADITTASYEQSTPAPITFDNSKNIPDYNSLSILDYIRNKEGVRLMRHTVNDKNGELSENPIQTDGITNTTPLLEESNSTKPNGDDTADLVPPKIDADYNSEFTPNSGTTENILEASTLEENIPRAGRGINFDSTTITEDYSTPVPTSMVEYTTITDDKNNLSITSVEDEQLRNTRHTGKELEETATGDSIPKDKPQYVCVSDTTDVSCDNVLEIQSNGNIIKLNLEQLLTKEDNSKVIYALPIVVIISSTDNLPIIKVVAENSSLEQENVGLFPMQPFMQSSSLDTNEYDIKSTENYEVEDSNLVSSGDLQQTL